MLLTTCTVCCFSSKILIFNSYDKLVERPSTNGRRINYLFNFSCLKTVYQLFSLLLSLLRLLIFMILFIFSKPYTPKVLFSIINSVVTPFVNTVTVASDALCGCLKHLIDKMSNLRPKGPISVLPLSPFYPQFYPFPLPLRFVGSHEGVGVSFGCRGMGRGRARQSLIQVHIYSKKCLQKTLIFANVILYRYRLHDSATTYFHVWSGR